MNSPASDIVWHEASVSTDERLSRLNFKPCVLWYTGLSGSGKSTVSNAVDRMLFDLGVRSYLLDGDNVRHGLNKDLGFSNADRVENIRRISEVSRLFMDAGLIVSTAFISPFISDRKQARDLIGKHFIEIHISTDLSVCEQRDPKGLYKKARAGVIPNFTGIDSPYEAPETCELRIDTSALDVKSAAQTVIDYLRAQGLLS